MIYGMSMNRLTSTFVLFAVGCATEPALRDAGGADTDRNEQAVSELLDALDAVSYTHLTLPTTPYV